MAFKKSGKVNIPGNLSVGKALGAVSVNVEDDLNVKGDSTMNNMVIKGDLTVMGKVYKSEQEGDSSILKDGNLYLGDPEKEESWKLSSKNGELFFEQKVDGNWVVKQSIA
jgi:hypothetical protein